MSVAASGRINGFSESYAWICDRAKVTLKLWNLDNAAPLGLAALVN